MNRTIAMFAVLLLTGGLEQVKAAPPGAESEMKDMRLIAGGAFPMGDVFDEGVRFATPVHEVRVSSFYLNKFEVTVEEFAAFVKDTGYVTSAEPRGQSPSQSGKIPAPRTQAEYDARLASGGAFILDPAARETYWGMGASWRDPLYQQSPQDPVVCVSWRDAVNYCNWLSKKEGLPVAYDAETGDLLDAQGEATTDVTKVRGYRLPTEAEWEYAARERGRKVRFGNGQDVARPAEINFNAAEGEFEFTQKGTLRGKTVPVGSFKPNSLGLHDMSGNVWEWCSDLVGAYPDQPQVNPYQQQGLMGPRRAARGGPWAGDASFARVSARLGWVADDRCNNIGFRVARSLGVEEVVWPDTPAARWAQAYVTAYNTPGEEALHKFITDHFSEAELRETPIKEMAAQYFQPRYMGLERLEARSVRTDGDLVAAVVAPAKPYGWIEFRFELSPEAPHSLVGLKIGPARTPDAEIRPAGDYSDWTDLGDLVERVRRDSGAPGIAVAIVREGRIVDKAVAGVRCIERPEQIEIGDRFHLGSVAKAFTATMIGKLVEDGVLRWDSTIGEVLPDIPMAPAFRAVTLEQLLQHRGGVRPMPSLKKPVEAGLGEQQTAAESRVSTVRQVLAESPVKPGEYAYSNASYVVAAYMAERAARESWESLTRRLVFEPLTLDSAGFGWPANRVGSDDKSQPAGHVGDPPNLEVQEVKTDASIDLQAIGPAGDLHCSIEDLARFAAFHLRGLRGEDGVLKAETVRRLHTPAEDGHYMGGWVIREAEGWHGHEGTAGTFFAEMTLYPDSNLAVVAMANCGPAVAPFFEKMKEAIVRSMTPEVERAADEPEVEWPDTVAGRRAQAFIQAMNAGDEGSLRRFVTENYSRASLEEEPIEQKIAMFQGIRAPMGTLKVSSVRIEGENSVIVVAKCQNVDIWLQLTIKLEKEPPHYWAAVKALPTAPPQSTAPQRVEVDR